jgi:hypothetical protein
VSILTNRELRDKLNSLEDHQLDYPVGVVWSDSDQTGVAKDVEVDGDGYVEIIA